MRTVGIDEVGRGCWAGPVVAGAVLLDAPIEGLRDSKQLSKRQRERLDGDIRVGAIAVGLGWVEAGTIDKLGISTAVKMAMQLALAQISDAYDELIVDGNLNYFADDPLARAVVKADATVPAVSAASIIAKVARDGFMADQSSSYPGYGFEKHVGYGTALHLARLQELGVTPLHRRSYKPVQALLIQ